MKDFTDKELAVIKVKCDKDLLFFTRFFFKLLRGTKFIRNWHHDEICSALEEIETYKKELLNINIPPRHSKTELVLNSIARGIGKNPSANYLYITASDELRAQTSVSIREIVTHPVFKRMYGVELKKDQNGKNLWRTKEGGGLKTATIFGQITGFGAGQMVDHNDELLDYIRNFEGLICLDDINKVDDSQSLNANNDKVARVFFNTVMSRKNSSDTPIVNIQQRAGMEDITYHILEHYKGKDGKIINLVYPVIYDGKPLWEWKHSMEDIEHLKKSPKTAATFETQYMQNPMPSEGILFPKDTLKYFSGEINMEEVEDTIIAVDIADTGEDSHSVIVGHLIGKKWYIDDVIHTTDEVGSIDDKRGNIYSTAKMIQKHKPSRLFIEINMGGSMYPVMLKNHLPGNTRVVPERAKSNKHTRIASMEGFIKDYFVFRSDSTNPEYDKFISELTRYDKNGNAKHDDAPDVTALLAKKIYLMYGNNLYSGVELL